MNSTTSRAYPVLKTGRLFFWAGFWFVVVFLSLWFINRDALKYFEWSEAVYLRFWPNRVSLAIHVLSAGVALLVGPIQFSKTVRRRWPVLHRRLGWVYVVGVMVSGPAAFQLSFHSCPGCTPPFVLWSALSFVITGFAIWTAVQKKFSAHRDFMIRSYVLMFGFVFVRLDTHLQGTPLEIPLPADAAGGRAPMLLWVVWVVPLIVTELVLSWWPSAMKKKKKARRFEKPSAS
ncbi:MAG: DUF2306 domain-containing protein [Gemmatimonadota bacterium]